MCNVKVNGFIRKTLGKCSVFLDVICCLSVFGLVGIIILTLFGVFVTVNAFVGVMLGIGGTICIVDSVACRYATIISYIKSLKKGDK